MVINTRFLTLSTENYSIKDAFPCFFSYLIFFIFFILIIFPSLSPVRFSVYFTYFILPYSAQRNKVLHPPPLAYFTLL